eukprot:TRINITY_DN54_c1_g1_i4.p1 TRINITY_DN54_c1_g1~~TRINITY_DN54_c1_g1_i4.p1  ORF type:complete len:225 (-),score=110.25 TRINITY_DN54_c1_g1_i4:70-720(-)
MHVQFYLIAFLLSSLFFNLSFATYGVDVSQSTSTSSFSCLVSNGYSFTVVRCYQSSNRVDPNAAATLSNAWSGGMKYVDVYMFPCPTCGNAKQQVTDAVNNLRNNGAKYGMFWLDIEGTQYWYSSQSTNRQFATDLANQAEAMGQVVGVYTSKSQWDPIMGSWSGLSKYALWYPHYDGSASFSDFVAFGGWTKPAIKQYAGTTSICSASVDKSWYP